MTVINHTTTYDQHMAMFATGAKSADQISAAFRMHKVKRTKR